MQIAGATFVICDLSGFCNIFPQSLIKCTIFEKKKSLNMKREFRFSLYFFPKKNSSKKKWEKYFQECTMVFM
jgi:hypothetical protein